jgi:hypothetical protein
VITTQHLTLALALTTGADISFHSLTPTTVEVHVELTEPAHGYQLLIPDVAEGFIGGEYAAPFDFGISEPGPYTFEGGVVMAAISSLFDAVGPGDFTLGTLTFDACVDLEPGCISVFCTEFSYAGEPVPTTWTPFTCPTPNAAASPQSINAGGCEQPPGCSWECSGTVVCWFDWQPDADWDTPMNFTADLGGPDPHFPEPCCDNIGGTFNARAWPNGPWKLVSGSLPQYDFLGEIECDEMPYTLPVKISETLYESKFNTAWQRTDHWIGNLFAGDDPQPPYQSGGRWLTCPPEPHDGGAGVLGAWVRIIDCPCDFDRDGEVSTSDILFMQAHPEAFDTADLLHCLNQWGSCLPSLSPGPGQWQQVGVENDNYYHGTNSP